MTDELHPAVPFVANKIAQEKWGALDALRWARGRDKVTHFRAAWMMAQLCGDLLSREDKVHGAMHVTVGLAPGDHADAAWLDRVRRSLGISAAQAEQIVADIRAEDRVRAALQGLPGHA